MLRFLRVIFYLVLIVGTLVVAGAGYYFHVVLSYRNPATVTITIPKGSSVRQIALLLETSKVIKNRFIFEADLRVTGKAKGLKAGEYEFEADLSFDNIITKMIEGKTKLYQFTIPEGFNRSEVCKTLGATKIMTETYCLEATKNVSLLHEKSQATSLEGFLFPETYSYDSQTTPQEMIQAMVGMFYKKIDDKRVKLAASRGLSESELVTLASVVEKETGLASERPLIAQVFFNRLKINMPLQSDPTVIYGLTNFNGNLTRENLQTDSPYNTYTRTGLPVGPICNPGLAVIDAVLNPAATAALYFVAKGSGSHYFSTTLEQHNAAVRYYQLKQGTEPPPGL